MNTKASGIYCITYVFSSEITVCFDQKAQQQQCSYMDYCEIRIEDTQTFCVEMFSVLDVVVGVVTTGI
jgi:hypothetical protein